MSTFAIGAMNVFLSTTKADGTDTTDDTRCNFRIRENIRHCSSCARGGHMRGETGRAAVAPNETLSFLRRQRKWPSVILAGIQQRPLGQIS
jgi:hypothetical protein